MAEIRKIVQTVEAGNDLLDESLVASQENIGYFECSSQAEPVTNKAEFKRVTGVISSPGYIDFLKQAKEKKEAEERKKKDNREKRLANAIEKMKQAKSRMEKLQKQVDNDKKLE